MKSHANSSSLVLPPALGCRILYVRKASSLSWSLPIKEEACSQASSVGCVCIFRMKRLAFNVSKSIFPDGQEAAEADGDGSDTDSGRISLPRVVGLGLRAVFDIIKETEATHPEVSWTLRLNFYSL